MTVVPVLAPMTGRVVPMEDVPDPVFAERMLGDGLAIQPSEGLAVAPIDGTLVVFHSAGHAFAIEGADGVSVLVHVGLDTVEMKGAGFDRLAEVGDHVTAGQPIVGFDLALIVSSGRSALSPVVLPQLDERWRMEPTGNSQVRAGRDVLLSLSEAAVGAS